MKGLYLAKTITYIFIGISSLALVHYLIYAFVGIFARKKFPATDKKLKYGVIIPARNEEKVVGNLIESVRKCKYPQDKLQIFVIAHNCSDKTAEVCRAMNATVYEYNNDEERTMGYAFRYLFDRIREDWGVENYDGFFLFNADNVLDELFFEKMNDAFVAEKGKKVITSYRNSKNFGANVISACYGLYFLTGCVFESRGRTYLGCSTRVQGTGYLINSELVKDGWEYVTLTEDWEFSADQLLKGNKIVYCDEAIFYDEQPTALKVTCTQRLRWAKGHLLVCISRFKDLIKALFTPQSKGGGKHKVSLYDMTVKILPVCVITSSIFLLSLLLVLLSPLFGAETDVTYYESYLILKGIVWAYATAIISAAVVYFVERKRIKNVSLPIKIKSAIVWPLFLFLAVPLEFIALFKDVGWKAIPHTDTTDFAALNGKSAPDKSESDLPAEGNI